MPTGSQWVRMPAGARGFPQHVQICSPPPILLFNGYRGLFVGVKRHPWRYTGSVAVVLFDSLQKLQGALPHRPAFLMEGMEIFRRSVCFHKTNIHKPVNPANTRCIHVGNYEEGRVQFKCDGTRGKSRFRLSAKRTSPFKSAGGVSSVDYWQPRCAHQR